MDEDTKINDMEITDEYTLATAKESVVKVAKKLRKLQDETDHGTILITMNKDQVVGYITKKEILEAVINGEDLNELKAIDILNKDFLEVMENDTLGDIIPTISKKYPNAVVVTNSKGKFVGFFSKNDYKDALAGLGIYDKAHAPKSTDDWRTRGIAMSSLGKKKEALECFKKSVSKSEDEEKGWSNLAKRLERLNRLKDSLMCYDKVLDINSENEEAMVEKGNIYSQDKTDSLAIQNYKNALELNPNNVDAWMNLGMEQANIGEIDEAMESIEKAMAIKGETPELMYKKGNVYEKAKKYEDALDCYNRATNLNDWFEEAWFNKGVAYNRLGMNEQALQCLIKILRINPSNMDARNALAAHKETGTLKMF